MRERVGARAVAVVVRAVVVVALSWTVGAAQAWAQVTASPSTLPHAQVPAPSAAPPAPSATAQPPDGGAPRTMGAPPSELQAERIPFSHILRDLGTDLKNLPSRDSAWIAGIGGAFALAAHPSDRDVSSDLAKPESRTEEFFDAGAVMGGSLAQIGGAFGVYAVGRMSGHSTLAAVGRDLVRAQVLDTVLTQGIKFAVQRTRPNGANYSFPSGHASTAFTTATVLTKYYGWKVGVPAYAMATYVSTSRLTDDKHYLSDVAFGAAIGILSARTSTLHLGRSDFALAPMTSPYGGVGVSLVRLPKP